MDDLLIFSAENSTWDRDGFEKSIGEECYFPPLTLEDGSEGTFLETSFKITASNCIRHWLKNTNELGEEPKVWRYAHFASYTPFLQKKAVLRYPKKVLWTACTTMGVSTRDTAWF